MHDSDTGNTSDLPAVLARRYTMPALRRSALLRGDSDASNFMTIVG